MSIKTEIARIKDGKLYTKNAIIAKDNDIVIPDNALINSYPAYVSQIKTGGSIEKTDFVAEVRIYINDVLIEDVGGYRIYVNQLDDNLNTSFLGVAGETTIKLNVKTNTPYEIMLSYNEQSNYRYAEASSFLFSTTTEYTKLMYAYTTEEAQEQKSFTLSGTLKSNNAVYTAAPVYIQIYDCETKELVGSTTTNTTYGYYTTSILKTNRYYCFLYFGSGKYFIPYKWGDSTTPFNTYYFTNDQLLTNNDGSFYIDNFSINLPPLTNISI